MGKIIVSENVTLDGIVQDPTGEEGFRRGGWFARYGGKDLEEWDKATTGEALAAWALLFGRRSYEFFAARWPSRTGALADRLNGMPKFVVSSALQDPTWNNTMVLTSDVVSEISKLKQQPDGDMVVYASFQLVHALMEHDLIDEVRLTVFPVVLGDGERLFIPIRDKRPMRLSGMRTLGKGLAHLTYARARDI